MSAGLLDAIKRTALDAVENSKPSDLRYGKVISTSPLRVRVTSQFIIPQQLLIVPQHLTEYEVEVSIPLSYGWDTQTSEQHDHDIVISRKKLKIHNELKIGDKVAMIRQAGGQHYLIIDRLVDDV